MKKVLILVIGCQLDPWNKMAKTSIETWDSLPVRGVDSIYYFGSPKKDNTEKFIYFDVQEGYNNMGYKLLLAFEWALKNKEFDYIARVNSSCYVDKKQLLKYVQTLPDNNVFCGTEVEGNPRWMWGGSQFIISKDIIQKAIDNRSIFNHHVMEDIGLSYLMNNLNVPYTAGKSCSLNEKDGHYLCIGYGGDSIEFSDFNDLKKLENHFYRVKIDRDRSVDEFLMNELHKVLC